MKSMKTLVCLVAFLAAGITEAWAVNVTFSDFSSTVGLTLNGNAVGNLNNGIDANPILRLVPATTGQSGSAFSSTTINASHFSTFFQFRISSPGGANDGTDTGAEGFVFVIQPVSSSIGGGGGGLGYQGISPSVGVEFDTWKNVFDPDSNHIGVDTNGSVDSLGQGGTVAVMPRFDDGNLWSVWIDYNGGNLEVRANQTGIRPLSPLLSQGINISGIIGQPNAFVGFTAGTGTAFGNHDIVNWEYRDTFNPIGDTVYQDTNNNGQQDAGEPGIPGVTVNLVATLLDGTVLNDSQSTDGTGTYLFTGIPAEAIAEVTVDPTTAPAIVEPGDNCPDQFVVTVIANTAFLDADFCFKLVADIIGDTVFLDLNDDGVQGPSEPGIPGVTVTLACEGEPLKSSTTDANGNYLFEGVPVDTDCTIDVDESASSTALSGKAPGNNCPDTFSVSLTLQAPSFVEADFCYLGVVAEAGPNQTKDEGASVDLDGTGSLPDPSTLTFAWSQLSGPDVTLSDPNVAEPNFMAPYVSMGGEVLVFELRVSRNSLFDTDQVTIHVRNINDPPSCELAQPNHDTLWPPNHTMHEITIDGVMDDGSPTNTITLDVTGVTQDEPVNGLGDGDASPDAVIQDDAVADTVLIRAERSGTGNGRVYQIHFTASDGAESCQGAVEVVVPHSRKATPVDDGQAYDSTQP